jgi:hypothetical protein
MCGTAYIARHIVIFLALVVAAAHADPTTLDCPLRQLLLDFSQRVQPFRPASAFQAIADALNGAPEANNCSVSPNPHLLQTKPIPPFTPAHSESSALNVAVDCSIGSDNQHADGSSTRPFRTLQAALSHIRHLRSTSAASSTHPAVISLGSGVHYVQGTLLLTAADSNLTIIGHSNSSFLSGGVPVDSSSDPLIWSRAVPPPRPAFEQRVGTLAAGQPLPTPHRTVSISRRCFRV